MTSLGNILTALYRVQVSQGPEDERLQSVRGYGSNPGQLELKVHAPVNREPGAALVVVLHGCSQTADEYAAPAGWLDLADRYGFVVMTPEQGRANNLNLCFNWYQAADTQRGHGEAASIAQMIAGVIRTYDLDAARVFITGLSAGGAMTSVMLATYPEIFSGGAIVAGLPYGSAASLPEAVHAMAMTSARSGSQLGQAVRHATTHPGPWPTVTVWHGQSDWIVRPTAGEAVVAQWCNVHEAGQLPQTARTADGRDYLVWRSPTGEPVVQMHRVVGLGHGAAVKADGPGGCGFASRYTPETGISSSFEIASGWGLVDGRTHQPSPGLTVTTNKRGPENAASARAAIQHRRSNVKRRAACSGAPSLSRKAS